MDEWCGDYSDFFGMKRDEVVYKLKENGIDTRLSFNGMHCQQSLMKFGCDCSGSYPVSDWLADNGFYLPSSSNLTNSDIEFISETLIKLCQG